MILLCSRLNWSRIGSESSLVSAIMSVLGVAIAIIAGIYYLFKRYNIFIDFDFKVNKNYPIVNTFNVNFVNPKRVNIAVKYFGIILNKTEQISNGIHGMKGFSTFNIFPPTDPKITKNYKKIYDFHNVPPHSILVLSMDMKSFLDMCINNHYWKSKIQPKINNNEVLKFYIVFSKYNGKLIYKKFKIHPEEHLYKRIKNQFE